MGGGGKVGVAELLLSNLCRVGEPRQSVCMRVSVRMNGEVKITVHMLRLGNGLEALFRTNEQFIIAVVLQPQTQVTTPQLA